LDRIGLDDSKANKLSFGLGPDLRAARLDLLPEKQSHPPFGFLFLVSARPCSLNIMRLVNFIGWSGKASVFRVYQWQHLK